VSQKKNGGSQGVGGFSVATHCSEKGEKEKKKTKGSAEGAMNAINLFNHRYWSWEKGTRERIILKRFLKGGEKGERFRSIQIQKVVVS